MRNDLKELKGSFLEEESVLKLSCCTYFNISFTYRCLAPASKIGKLYSCESCYNKSVKEITDVHLLNTKVPNRCTSFI